MRDGGIIGNRQWIEIMLLSQCLVIFASLSVAFPTKKTTSNPLFTVLLHMPHDGAISLGLPLLQVLEGYPCTGVLLFFGDLS